MSTGSNNLLPNSLPNNLCIIEFPFLHPPLFHSVTYIAIVVYGEIGKENFIHNTHTERKHEGRFSHKKILMDSFSRCNVKGLTKGGRRRE